MTEAPAPPPAKEGAPEAGRRAGFSFGDFAGAVLSGLLAFALLPMGAFFLLGDGLPYHRLVLLAVWVAILGIAMFTLKREKTGKLLHLWKSGDFDDEMGFTLATAMAAIVLFGLVFHTLQIMSSSHFLPSGPVSPWGWIAYCARLSWEGIQLFIPLLPGFRGAFVEPQPIPARILLWTYRILWEFLYLAAVFRLFRFLMAERPKI